VGLELFVAEGPRAVNALTAHGLSVFLDVKIHDIPNTAAGAARSAVRMGTGFITLHASGGVTMMREAMDAACEESEKTGIPRPALLAVTALTSLDRQALTEELGWSEPESLVKRLSELAVRAGMDGIVASPQEISTVRQVVGKHKLIVTPGVRPSWYGLQDQRRVMGPGEAIAEGADYIVVGRPVTQAPDPTGALKRILDEIAAQTGGDRTV